MRSTRSRTKLIGVVLPAYNEAAVIGSVLDGLPTSIRIGKTEYDIRPIVVNDGSRDETAAIASSRTRVKVINHVINSGNGAATRTGLHFARDLGCDLVITMDADGQHSAEDAKNMMKAIAKGQADLIIGNRLSSGGNMPTHKKIGNRGLGLITYLLLGTYVADSQSGLRALNKRALETIEFYSNDYAFCSEMIWRARRGKLKIAELPVKAIYTEYSRSRATAQKDFTGAINIITQLAKRRLMDLLHG